MSQHRPLFHPVDHFVGVGNNGKIQERLRRLEGALLLWGPEAKPILDPNFPNRETVDIGKYLDLTRWLECANGGKFEWGTGAEEKQVLKADGDPYVALVFPSTNVNLCLYQQFNLFKNWWVKVEHKHQCGFAARVLMTPTTRAIVDIDTGLLDARLMDSFFQKVWLETVTRWGPQVRPASLLSTSASAQRAVRKFYDELHELTEAGSWGSAGFASLGKMECHVPSAALLCSFQDWALSGNRHTVLPDNAVKCGIRHFDLRVVHGCNINT